MGVTPAGAMFRRHAQTILNAEAEARADLAMADLSGLTTLRLGMIEDFDAEVTPLLLADLSGALKGCRFLLETGASHRLMDQLEARALDIVIAADSAGDPAPDNNKGSATTTGQMPAERLVDLLEGDGLGHQ